MTILPSALQSQRVAECNVRQRQLAGRTEARVGVAVAVVARQAAVAERGIAAKRQHTRHQDRTVGLHDDVLRDVDSTPNVGRELAAAAEARVRRPVAVVARDREVGRDAARMPKPALPDHDDLAVGLDRKRKGSVGLAIEIGRDLAAVAEARSGLPSTLKRATAKSKLNWLFAVRPTTALPTTMILPSL